MSEKRWYTVNTLLFRKPVDQKVGQATITTSTSPYAVPDAIATYKDGTAYVLEMKYIGPEEPLEAKTWQHLTFFRGKNSHRLFQVTIPQPSPPQQGPQVLEVIKDAITNVSSGAAWPLANSAIVAAVIDETKKETLLHNDDRFALGA